MLAKPLEVPGHICLSLLYTNPVGYRGPAAETLCIARVFPPGCLPALAQTALPLSAAIFKSEEKNPVPQCPPRLDVQTIQPVLWSRMPSSFLKVETERVSERHGWVVQCLEPLQMMALHIPEENR